MQCFYENVFLVDVDKENNENGTFLPLCSKYLSSITTKGEGCFRHKAPNLNSGAAVWPAVWVRGSLLTLMADLNRLKHSATSLNHRPSGKITMARIAWVPIAWPANNHPWNAQFCPSLEEKEMIPVRASRDLSSFVFLHRPWAFYPGSVYSALHHDMGELFHLISLRGAHSASFKLLHPQRGDWNLK